MTMIEGEPGNLIPVLDSPRRYTVAEIADMMEKAASASPHFKADLGLISREEAYRLDPRDPIRIRDYVDILGKKGPMDDVTGDDIRNLYRRVRDVMSKHSVTFVKTGPMTMSPTFSFLELMGDGGKTELELDESERYDERFWQEGQAGNCNIVSFNGEDVRPVGYVQNDMARRRLMITHNRIVRQLIKEQK